MIDLKLNRKRLGQHWHYYWSRYLIFLVAALVGANFLFSTTAPRVPPEKKVQIIVVSNVVNNDAIESWQQDILAMLPPDQLEVSIESLPIIEGQAQTSQEAVVARMSAQEGTIWIMTSDYYASFAASGAFRALDADISSFNVPEGTKLDAAVVNVQPDQDKPGTKQLCGIPLDKVSGLSNLLVPVGLVMAFPAYSDANYANAKVAANFLLSKTQDIPAVSSAPADKQVSLVVAGQSFAANRTSDWQKALNAALPSGQGSNVFMLPFAKGRESYVADLIHSRMAQIPGGVCVVPQEVFAAMAGKGYLLPLDGDVSSLKLPAGVDLSAGKEAVLQRNGTAGPTQLYGIPLDQVPGLSEFFDPKGMVLVMPAPPAKKPVVNHEGAIAAANWILGKQ